MKYKNSVTGEEMEYEDFEEISDIVQSSIRFAMFLESYSKEFGFKEAANLIKAICNESYQDGYKEAY